MPYFPTELERAYYCPNCEKWFISTGLCCLVLHPPGTCCHRYEKEVLVPYNAEIKPLQP